MNFLRRLLRSLRLTAPQAAHASACDACPLGACRAGSRATIVCIACPAHDAERLRTLGVFEGVLVGVVDTRSGMVLDVRGSRLAVGMAVAHGITVQPLSA